VQGLELPRILIFNPVDTGSRRDAYIRNAPTLCYVAISRVKALDRLAFANPFSRQLVEAPNSRRLQELFEEENRLLALEAAMPI